MNIGKGLTESKIITIVIIALVVITLIVTLIFALTGCQNEDLPVVYAKNPNRFRYRVRKVRNQNGFGLFLYKFSQLNFIDIFLSKRLLGRT